MEILHKLTYKRDLPFTMKVKGKVFSKKTATLYFIKSSQGILTTEIAPFPGISDHSLQSCEYQFEKSLFKEDHPNPHVAFSLFELNFKSSWRDSLLFETIELNGLSSYKDFKTSPYKTIKIKIDDDLESILAFLKHKSKELSDQIIRFDGNRQLTSDQVQKIYDQALKLNLNIEYFEEPLKVPKELMSATYPFALDESLVTRNYFPHLTALVFKPTQYFNQNIWQERDKFDLIISSTFDSIFTQATLLAMAQTLRHKKAHGLDHGHAYTFLGKLSFLNYDDIFPFISHEIYQKVLKNL